MVDKHVDVEKDNNGNIITGDRNIIILFFSNISIEVNRKMKIIFLLIFIISWFYFTQKKEINDSDTTLILQKQQLRGKITDMTGNSIQGIKVVLPNGESNKSNENGEYFFDDISASGDTIKVRFEFNKSQYENPDEDNNNNQQLGLVYNPVQFRLLD